MKRRMNPDDRNLWKEWDDRMIEELAECVPALDDAAKDRIERLCEEKMELRETMNTQNTIYATNVENITRTQRYRPLIAAAACLLLTVGAAGVFMMGTHRPGVTPPVATDVPTEMTTEPTAETQPNHSDTNGSDIREALHILTERAMMVSADYPTKGEALEGTSLYEVDFAQMEADGSPYDYASFEFLIRATFTPDVADWVLNDSIYKEIDGVLYIDEEKAAHLQGVPVNWSAFTVTIDAITEMDTGNTCTFRAIATDDPAIQFPDLTVEDRTDYYTAQQVDELGWRLSEKPEYLVKE